MRYYIIAGEASGDLHGSNLIRALHQCDPETIVRGWGGDLMEQAGAEIVKHYRDLAFMGFLEVLIHLPTILRNLKEAQQDILDFHPDVVILIDYPGFNLRIARFLKKQGIRVFYYISPQLWAWKSSRVNTVKACVDHMFVILPFEESFYATYGYPVDFVGHPLLDLLTDERTAPGRSSFLNSHHLTDSPIIALLPGSRKQEIRTMLRIMSGIIPSFPGYQFVIACAPSVPEKVYRSALGNRDVAMVSGQTYDLLSHAEAAIVTSGTATLETALIGVPEVVCYKGSRISFWIARQLVHVRFISLVNLIMDREVVTELIQHALTPKNLIRETKRLLDPGVRKSMQDNFALLRKKLGGRGASVRTAQRIVQYLQDKSVN